MWTTIALEHRIEIRYLLETGCENWRRKKAGDLGKERSRLYGCIVCFKQGGPRLEGLERGSWCGRKESAKQF